MRFNVYRSGSLLGVVPAQSPTEAFEVARDQYGEGPFTARMVKSPSEITAYIQTNKFVRGQDRIGIQVWRAPCAGKRAKEELAIGADAMHLYDLTGGRRRLSQSWDLDR